MEEPLAPLAGAAVSPTLATSVEKLLELPRTRLAERPSPRLNAAVHIARIGYRGAGAAHGDLWATRQKKKEKKLGEPTKSSHLISSHHASPTHDACSRYSMHLRVASHDEEEDTE